MDDMVSIGITMAEINSGKTSCRKPSRYETVEMTVPIGLSPDHVLPERSFVDATTCDDIRQGKQRYISWAEHPKFTWGDEE